MSAPHPESPLNRILGALRRAAPVVLPVGSCTLYRCEGDELRALDDELPPSGPARALAAEALEKRDARCAPPADGHPALLATPLCAVEPPVLCACWRHALPGATFSSEDLRAAGKLGHLLGTSVETARGLRELFEEVGEGVFITDLRGHFIDVNPAGCALLGCSREEVQQLSYVGLLDPEHLAANPIPYDELLAGQTIRVERLFRRLDGSSVLLSLSGRRIAGDRLVAFAQDVTARRKADEAVRESEVRYRALCDTAFDAIVLHEEGRIIAANPASGEMFGAPPEALLGRAVVDLVSPNSLQTVAAALRDGSLRPYEATGKRTDGTTVELEVCGREVPFEGRTVRLAAAKDIGARKAAERQLQQFAAERKKLAGQVIAAHEQERVSLARELHDGVGQLLVVLKMEADWLSRHADDPEEVRAATARLGEKVDELIASVRRMSTSLRPTILDDIGIGCALEALIRELTAHAEITCEATIAAAEHLPGNVATAAYRIAQEALTNMVRHGEANECWIDLEDDGATVTLRVQHDGVAVEPGDLKRGLGITSMRERADLLDGSLTLTPRPGGGTRLEARLPYR